MLALSGCSQAEPIELVAIRGCGLDQEFSGLRVRVLGDFAPAAGSELLLGPGERGRIPELPSDATAVVAEGLFGTTVTAIGRSHGIDPELARGRIPGIADELAILPIYFAAPNSLCELSWQPSARSSLAAAAGPAGDVLLAGGISKDATLLDELVHVDLFADQVRTLDARLPSPRRGASVHALGGRRFAVLGGATRETVLAERIDVDVSAKGRALASSWALALAHHAAARGPDGRVLIVGGCDRADQTGACVASSAQAGSTWIDLAAPDGDEPLPDLEHPRFGAHALVTRDGVAFVAGGFGSDGLGLGSVERLTPNSTWTVIHKLPDERPIAGMTVLDGGLLLLSDRLGAIHWWSEAGSGTLDPTSRAPALGPIDGERPLLALPGERVLIDGWLFAPATAAVDPALERVQLSPSERSDSLLLPLADGTVLIAGTTPTLLRLRPELDGPHEWIPDLAGPQTHAFVCNAPGAATVILGGLQLDAAGSPANALPSVHAHVRGFRSGALRLELGFETDASAVAHVVLGQGAATLVSIALLPDQLLIRRRDASGMIEQLDCARAGVQPGSTVVLELAEQGTQLRLEAEQLLAECSLAWPSSAGVSVGFGVSGTGSARFYGLRLARQ